MFNFVQDDGEMAVLDHRDLFFDTFTGTDTYDIAADTYHPNAHGYTMIAAAVTSLLTGSTGQRVDPRPRIIPSTTTLHSTQVAVMPDGAEIIKYTP
jgi:hypothetical protein